MSKEVECPHDEHGREDSSTNEEMTAALQQQLAETKRVLATVQAQLQTVIQRQAADEQARHQEQAEGKKLLAERERQVAAARSEVEYYARDIASLVRWLEQLDRGFASVIDSQQWRLGSALASLYRKLRFQPPLPQPQQFLKNIQEKVRTWHSAFDRRTLAARTAMRLRERDKGGAGVMSGPRGLFPSRRERPRATREPLMPGVLEPGKISLIVLNRNGAAHLQNLFTSFVARNTYRNVEWLVVDHASSDESLNVLREWQSRLSLDIIACETNYSFAYSNNVAAKKASGDYLFFLNNDIIFDDDVLPLLVHQLQANVAEVGLVGIQLIYPASHAHLPGQIQHLGIRFFADMPFMFHRPYELGAKAPKHLWMTTSERVPAVTAAAVLCRREELLGIGGFCEDYVYGYEDVDLCLSYWSQLKKGSCCLTNTWLIHDESATRRLQDTEERDARMRHNREVLQKRYGYAIKKAVQLDGLRGTHFWTDAGFVVAFVVTAAHEPTESEDYFTVAEFALACGARFGWQVQFLVHDADWYNLDGIDVLIVMVDSYDLTRSVGAKPTLVTLAWLRNGFERWAHVPGFDDYAIYLCSSEEEAQLLMERQGKYPHVLRLAPDEQGVTCLQSILVDFHDHKFRLAIKVPGSSGEGDSEGDEYQVAVALKHAWVKQGHAVRIDLWPEWDTARGFGDDVVLVLRGKNRYVPKPEQLNLLWQLSPSDIGSPEECDPYDHVFVASSAEAERLRDTVRTPVSTLLPCTDLTRVSPEVENRVATVLEVIAALDRRKRFAAEGGCPLPYGGEGTQERPL